MSDNDFDETNLVGTQEKKIETVRVGGRISETGIVKRTSYEENMTEEGTLERLSTVEFGQPDCDHVGVDIGGQCLCGLWWCKECATKNGTCHVCGRLVCPTCGKETVLDKSRKYHKACFWKAVKMKLFG